jgi:hypothetical protein
MSALSSSQINQSYQGLLKLADSTTGITSSVQSIQDGLGNETGFKIAENRIQGGNVFPIYSPGVAPYYGTGMLPSGSNPGTNNANKVNLSWFYDNGVQSYSAITMNCTTLAAGESITVTFYDAQRYDDFYGYTAKDKLVSEVTLSADTTGLKTAVFSTPLSFSGTGPGFYFFSVRYNTGAATPVQRFGSSSQTTTQTPLALNVSQLGFVGTNTNAFVTSMRTTATSYAMTAYDLSSFPSSWDSSNLSQSLGYTITTAPGFVLHTIK